MRRKSVKNGIFMQIYIQNDLVRLLELNEYYLISVRSPRSVQ